MKKSTPHLDSFTPGILELHFEIKIIYSTNKANSTSKESHMITTWQKSDVGLRLWSVNNYKYKSKYNTNTNKSENTNTHDYQLVDRRMYEAGVGSPVVVGGQLACFSKLVGRILGIVMHFAFLDIVMDVFLYICAIAGWLCSVVLCCGAVLFFMCYYDWAFFF